jgi:succinoglycan biosynthesis transport protein ExoP
MSDSHLILGPANRNGKPFSGDLAPRQYFEAPPGGQPPEEEPDGLITYWRILRRHKGALLLAATLGAIAGILITFPQTPVYQATVAIEIQGLNDDFLNMRSINPTVSNNYDPSYDIQTQVREMQSRAVMERVIKKMNTMERAALTIDTGRVSLWRKALHLSEPKPPSLEEVVGTASVRIKPSLSSRIVEITCDSINAKVAAQFANTVAEEYIKQNLESRWQATQQTGEWLNLQIQELKIKLEKSEDELQGYMTSAGLLFITGEKEKENVAEERLRQLQTEVLKAESDRVAKQSHYDLMKNFSVESLPEVMDDKTLAEYQGKLTDLRRQMADLDVALTPSHPKVQRLQAQIDTVEAWLKKTRSNIQERINNDYQAALNREKLLASQFDIQKEIVSDQAAKVVHYNILKREVDTNRQIYEAMLQRVKESGIVSAMRASGVRIVDPAVPPGDPYKPNIPRSGALGCMGGIFLGAMLVFLRERSNRNLEQPGDAAFYLNIPELGVIPTSTTDPVKLVDRGLKSGASDGNNLIRPELDPVELVTWNRKFSLLAEAFRTTLTSLLFSGHNGDQPRVIVLTSANPSEGKTTVTINLAIALAEINRRVLLIDADMRRPRLQNLFELGPGPGLADLLREKTTGGGMSSDQAICPTAVPGLYVMRSGRNSGVVSNLLHSARLPELLQQLRNEFDAVVIDTPPVLHISDARVIGRLADAVLLIVRAGQTTRDAAQMVKQRFGEDGTPLLGTILNGWNPKHDVYGYKYRYYNGNGASYSQKETVSEHEKE